MFSLLQKIRTAFSRRAEMFAEENRLAARFRQTLPPTADDTAPLIMVEGVEDSFFYGLQGEIVRGLRALGNVRAACWVSHSLNAGAANSLQEFIAGRMYRCVVSRAKWTALYRAFCDAGTDRADYLRAPWRELSWAWRAFGLFRLLENKDQLAALRVSDIRVGDLVIDSYLRFRPAAEVDLRDWYLFFVLRQTVKDVDSVMAWFRKSRPALYLSTYSTYIQHGIAARVAVALGIKTWAFGNAQEIGTRLEPGHLVQIRRCGDYSADFANLTDRQAKISHAAELIEARLGGAPDLGTSNRRSAYQVKTLNVPDVRGAAVVFLHDFYDSPHLYRWMMFHDFWEWACFTIETLRKAGLPFFVKPHPNQRAESSVEIARLTARYPGINFISSDVSNLQLFDAGMACAITVYGSVAAEMAYLGVPSISCGDNPHVSFDSFHLATSKEEYRRLLCEFPGLSRDRERMKFQACAFYYMHFLNMPPDELELRDKAIAFFVYMVNLQQQQAVFVPAELERIVRELENSKGFARFVANLAADLQPRMIQSRSAAEGAQVCLPTVKS